MAVQWSCDRPRLLEPRGLSSEEVSPDEVDPRRDEREDF